jgi:hypothetical protein
MVEASDPNDIFGVVIVFLTCQALSKAPKLTQTSRASAWISALSVNIFCSPPTVQGSLAT